MTEEAEAESSSAPHKIRITSSGSIKAYVRFALAFLEEHPARPLVLHTIPPSDSKPNTEKSANSTVDSGTLLAPRLISVVEIIKREYLARLSSTGKGSGKHKARGVWQYTETGLLPKEGSAAEPLDESGGMEGGKNARSEQLVRALEGKTNPKMTHRPFLQITLSTRPLGLEKEKNITCQYLLANRRRNPRKSLDAMKAQQGLESEKITADPSVADAAVGTDKEDANVERDGGGNEAVLKRKATGSESEELPVRRKKKKTSKTDR